MLKEGGTTPADRIAWAWKTATNRTATPEEIAVLSGLLSRHQQAFEKDAKQPETFLTIGLKPVEQGIAKAELAAYTSVARAILNLHETVTRP